MSLEAAGLWERAAQALHSAKNLLSGGDSDGAASRAYYAAFYAVSALFALEGKTFTKHSALESAVHRDLVKAGLWSETLGEDYTYLRETRETGDYGGAVHVTRDEADSAIQAAERILTKVRAQKRDAFADWKKDE